MSRDRNITAAMLSGFMLSEGIDAMLARQYVTGIVALVVAVVALVTAQILNDRKAPTP